MANGAFSGQVVIVSGASSGLGRELAFQLADQGALLSLAARDAARLEAVASECARRGGKALVVPTDVSDEEQCEALVERTVSAYGRIDTLINNAGCGARGNLEELPDLSHYKTLMNVNFFGSLHCTYHALPHLKQSGGRLVAVSSIVGRVAIPGEGAYCASKFAVTALFNSLRMELAGSGVSVTVIYPGYIVTEFSERSARADGQPHGEAGRRLYTKAMMPADRCARLIIRAAAKRKREVFTRLQEKFSLWMHLGLPSLTDVFIRNHIRSKDARVDGAEPQAEGESAGG